MEQKEVTALEKADHLVSTFERSFLHVRPTFHPAGIQGEIAGKSSNVAFAANRIVEIHRAELSGEYCNVVVTVMDGKFIAVSRTSVRVTNLRPSGHPSFARLLHRDPPIALYPLRRGGSVPVLQPHSVRSQF